MSKEAVKYISLIIGSLTVALSGTVVAVHAPSGQNYGVSAGYIIFVLGYKTCWFGSHQKEGIESIKQLKNNHSLTRINLRENITQYFLIFGGLYLASYGTIEFFNLVENPGILKGIETGLTSFGGYIMAHEAVNEAPI